MTERGETNYEIREGADGAARMGSSISKKPNILMMGMAIIQQCIIIESTRENIVAK
jgi:hypothetical protein